MSGLTVDEIMKAVKEFFRSFITGLSTQGNLGQLCWRPVLQSHMLIWKPSLLKYNFRMAQVMQWPPAIRNYISEGSVSHINGV